MTEDIRGVLSRRGGFFSGWSKYTYSVKENYLIEYKLGANPLTSEPLQMMDLKDALLEDAAPITGKPASFVLHGSSGKSFFFLAPSVQEKNKWMQNIQKVISPSANSFAPTAPTSSFQPARANSGTQVANSSSSVNSTGSKGVPVEPTPAPAVENGSFSSIPSESDLEAKIPILKYLESFTDAVIVGNINGLIVATNTAADKLFGYSGGELNGEPLLTLMPEPFKSQHDGYLFRHEKFGSEKLIGKTRNLKGVRKNHQDFDLQISLGKLPVKGYYIATIRELGAAN